ncbi:MAG TPA: hypothetical protein VN688_28760 [Gemmataceae bacterium]|nr:hypothetical protein [Gemmataceae bacterium]
MDIHTLKLSITEEEINTLVAEFPSSDSAVENLRVRLTPEGIVAFGDYPAMLMKMAFETLWEVKGAGSVVEARLASIKVSGLPAKMLRGVLLKTIRDMTAQEPGVRVEDESIRIDLSKHTAIQRLRLRVNLTGVRCSSGNLVIEAGPETA